LDYACIAVLRLALVRESERLVRLRDLADPHGIPTQFLVQILQQLKAAGVVASTRGAHGGYRLVRDPGQLTVGEIREIIEGPKREQPHGTNGHPSDVACAVQRVWRRVDRAEQEILDAVSFAELAREVGQSVEPMYYI
jgi:Rrf2 family protein